MNESLDRIIYYLFIFNIHDYLPKQQILNCGTQRKQFFLEIFSSSGRSEGLITCRIRSALETVAFLTRGCCMTLDTGPLVADSYHGFDTSGS